MLIQEILKLSGNKTDPAAKTWVAQINNLFPRNPLNDSQRVAIFGDDKNPVTVVFELVPSKEKDTAEIAWIQASPRKSGGASRLIRFLQTRAKGKGISLVLTPQRNGEIGGDTLADIYKGLGFKHDKEKDVMVWESAENDTSKVSATNVDAQFQVKGISFDNQDGIGAVPYNAEIKYRGFVAEILPSDFLKLASQADRDKTAAEMAQIISSGQSIGSPFLEIEIANGEPKVVGHEGRGRMRAIMRLHGDTPIPVHFFLRAQRAKDVTPELLKDIRSNGIIPQDGGQRHTLKIHRIFLRGDVV